MGVKGAKINMGHTFFCVEYLGVMAGLTASRDSPVSVELSSDISISSSSRGGIPACLPLSDSEVAWINSKKINHLMITGAIPFP